jgi:hypothetical protein
MNEERIGSTAVFARELAQRVPDVEADDLASLIELAFFASLHEEEARRNELAIVWASDAHDCMAVMELRAPVPATPKNLAKLAPAAQRGAALAVRREHGGLAIWGLLQHGKHRPLTIRAIAAGVLRVEHRGIPRALYARGEAIFLDGVKSPAKRLTRAFACWAEEEIHPRAAIMTRIALRALDHGHGGMILIVPSNAEPLGVRAHYALGRGGDHLASVYTKVAPAAVPDQLQQIEGGSELARAIDAVASLTATDNALLIDTDLRVRGFGVQVVESDAPNRSFEHVSPYTEDVHVDDISTFKGTRHPAGVIFCLRQPNEAAAIIASQDGRLSLATRDARGAVEVLGSYERAFGWR